MALGMTFIAAFAGACVHATALMLTIEKRVVYATMTVATKERVTRRRKSEKAKNASLCAVGCVTIPVRS